MELRIDSIAVGIRHRREMGDIGTLAGSISEIGLLHPVVVRPDGTLIAGERRLAACRSLGWSKVPATVVDIASIARGELAENTQRKDFLLSEAVAIKRAVEEEERRLAKERQAKAGPAVGRGAKKNGSAKLAPAVKGKTRDKVATTAGKARTSLSKADAIISAAEAEPERFGKLVEDMDRTGRVDGPFKRLKVMQQAEQIRREPPPLPSRGPYRVIVADPPWPYELRKEDPSHRATHPYPQMSMDQIRALDVGSIAHTDCILWLWTTNHHMREAFTVLDAWGFEHKTIVTWVKDRMGTGDWLRGQSEHCLMAVRGHPIVHLTNQTTVLYGPLRANSQKPDEFYDLVESLCPAPRYAYLFSREQREGWDMHGDEAIAA